MLFLISLHFLRSVLLLPQHCSTSSFLSSSNIPLYSLTIFLKAPLVPPFSFLSLFLSSSSLHFHCTSFCLFSHFSLSFLPSFFLSVILFPSFYLKHLSIFCLLPLSRPLLFIPKFLSPSTLFLPKLSIFPPSFLQLYAVLSHHPPLLSSFSSFSLLCFRPAGPKYL